MSTLGEILQILTINSTIHVIVTSDYVIKGIALCLEVVNNEYIMLSDFGGRRMSGFQIIKGGGGASGIPRSQEAKKGLTRVNTLYIHTVKLVRAKFAKIQSTERTVQGTVFFLLEAWRFVVHARVDAIRRPRLQFPPWAQLFEDGLALNPGLNLTWVSFSCVQKHFLG